MAESEQQDVTPFFGSFILETLTLGMYSESRNAIREYIQNAFDSITLARDQRILPARGGTIRVRMDGQGVTIEDDGVGMPSSTAGADLTMIGASKKDYRRQAGFRGIGRLSGLVLCDQLVFKTKAKGDKHETEVVFDCKGIREDLAPTRTQGSLEKLLKRRVKISKALADDLGRHFFRVELNGLHEPPIECESSDEMVAFLGQVAPVDYRSEFFFADRVRQEAQRRDSAIAFVTIIVETEDGETRVLKPYGEEFLVGRGTIPLEDVQIHESPTGYWWGWTSTKAVPGAFGGTEAGIRIRVRNIQIDGTELMRDIFGSDPAKRSYTRFNEWYLGEIFVTTDDLVPNARRDGFEENPAWLAARAELVELAGALGAEAYELSSKSQVAYETLLKDLREVEGSKSRLASTPKEQSLDVLVDFTKRAEKLQKKLAKAIRLSAEADVVVRLRRLETKLLSARTEFFARFGGTSSVDRLLAMKEAEQATLEKIVIAFQEKLDARTCEAAMEVLEELFGSEVRQRR